MTFVHLITTVGGAGHLRPAPGTWGSFVALPLAWMVATLLGIWGFSLLTAALYFIGIQCIKVDTSGKDNHDPSEIVIDELVGQWIALFPVIYGAYATGSPLLALWPGWVAAFVFFRLFDIWKPGPVGWADRRHDAVGVMLDDVIAGVMAAIVVVLLAGLAHGVMMI